MKWKPSIPVVIIFLGAILRVFLSFWWGFSNDELSALSRTVYSNFSDLIEFGVMETDMHPAGVQIFLFSWVNIFGTAEWVVRLPFIVASSFGLYGFYKFFRLYWSEDACTIFLIFASFLFYPILNSQFARPYAMGFFFIGLALYFIQKFIKNDFHWKYVLFIGLSWAGVFYSNYFATLFAGILALAIVPLIPRKKIVWYLASGLLSILLYLPHISITNHHMDQGGLGWLPPPKEEFLFDFLFHIGNSSWVLIGLIVILTLIGLIFSFRDRLWKQQLYNLWAFGCFFAILFAAFYYSIHVTPILKFQTLFFAFPFLLIPISDWIQWPSKYSRELYFSSILVCVLATSVWSKELFSRTTHFAVYRELAIDAHQFQEEFGEENIEFVTSDLAPYYVDFYFQRYGMDYKELPVQSFRTKEDLIAILEQAKKDYFYYAYSNAVHSPEFFEVIREYYPGLRKANQYFHSGTWLFSKVQGERTYKDAYGFDFAKDLADSLGFKVIRKGQYSQALRMNVKNVSFTENDYFLFEMTCVVPPEGNVDLVFVGDRDKKLIEDNGVAYYLAKGNEGQTGEVKIRLVGDIKTYMLNQGGLEEFVFYFWNNSEQSVLVKEVNLYLVDPSKPDKFE